MSLAAAVARARSSLNMPLSPTGRLWGRGASAITSRLYLSDLWTACDAEKMEKLGITHIISVIEHRPALPDCVPMSRRHQVFLADRSDSNIITHLAECTKFIVDALEENESNKVLVRFSIQVFVVWGMERLTHSRFARRSLPAVPLLARTSCSSAPGSLPARHKP